MLLNTDKPETKYPWMKAAGGLAVFLLLSAGVVALFLNSGALDKVAGPTPPELSNNPAEFATAAKAFGRLLYTKYMLPLQMAGLLLLLALVGVVNLSKDAKPNA
jgi:NADH:ubiquinone oxidoreductase subunit 6 (subunit J)